MLLKPQKKYLQIDNEKMLFKVLLFLQQGTSKVDDYTNKFHELNLRSQISKIEHRMILHYKAGLRGDIKKKLLIVRLVSIEEAYQLALQVE